jgi:CRP/FNR family cyclic AMP-dependent transcriptional regulator
MHFTSRSCSSSCTERTRLAPLPSIIETLPVVSVAAGEDLVVEGSPPAGLFFLISGMVEVTKRGATIIRVRERGAVFGEMAILLNQPHTATVRAIQDSQFRRADPHRSSLESNPELCLYIAEILARRLDALNSYLVDLKSQFKDRGDHLGMVDEILDSLMSKHPRKVERRDEEM